MQTNFPDCAHGDRFGIVEIVDGGNGGPDWWRPFAAVQGFEGYARYINRAYVMVVAWPNDDCRCHAYLLEGTRHSAHGIDFMVTDRPIRNCPCGQCATGQL